MIRGKAEHAGYECAFGKEIDPYHMFIGIVPHLVYLARRSTDEEAYSYRGFHVGASLFALLPKLRQTVLFSAGNTKLENEAKLCAEMRILNELESYGQIVGDSPQAIGLVIVGTSDRQLIKGVTGRESSTLHPCQECQDIMGKSSVITDETLIVTAGIDSDDHQVHSYGQLRDFYDALRRGDDPTDSFAHGSPNFDQWHTRQAFYDYMSGPYGQEVERKTPAEAARIAVSSVFVEPHGSEQEKPTMTDEEEAEILKRMAHIVNPPLR